MDPILAAYGLKHNPFANGLEPSSYAVSKPVEHFIGRVERLAKEGGFALITGTPGTGKSTALRHLEARLTRHADLRFGEITRPQCAMPDLYRELGDLFGVMLSPHNRWAGTQVLRERWQRHIDGALFRPVVVIDEAQGTKSTVLSELRMLASVRLDSRVLLTVVIAGDERLTTQLKSPELAPLDSRIRVRLAMELLSADELAVMLDHVLAAAGNPALMTDGLKETLCERASGNLRTLANLGAELLDAGMQRGATRLDEKLYLEVFTLANVITPRATKPGKKAR